MRHAQIFHVLTCVKIIFKIVSSSSSVTRTVTSFQHTVGTKIGVPEVSLYTHPNAHVLARTHTHRTSLPLSRLLKLRRTAGRRYLHSRSLCFNVRMKTTMPTASVLSSYTCAVCSLGSDSHVQPILKSLTTDTRLNFQWPRQILIQV
jgi:hypothetical protein